MTYDDKALRKIAQAIGAPLNHVRRQRRLFEAAAVWYRLDQRAPRRLPPSVLSRRLKLIARQARALLKVLGIDDPATAPDGPGDIELLGILASSEGNDENAVLRATTRIGRLSKLIEAIQATCALETMAENAGRDVATVHRHIVPPGNQGNAAVNNWIAAMLSIYRTITGCEPGTSVGASGSKTEGEAGGPLIRFLDAAGAPLEICYSSDAWRRRVRMIQQQSAVGK